MPVVLFALGQIVATPGVLEALREAGHAPDELLRRHVSGDWGDLDEHDRKENVQALRNGSRILSAYHLPDGVKIWIITEADRSSTTLLLPEEC